MTATRAAARAAAGVRGIRAWQTFRAVCPAGGESGLRAGPGTGDRLRRTQVLHQGSGGGASASVAVTACVACLPWAKSAGVMIPWW